MNSSDVTRACAVQINRPRPSALADHVAGVVLALVIGIGGAALLVHQLSK